MALMSIKNLTIGVIEVGFGLKIDKINNKITGPIGRLHDRMYVHKNKRDCILKSVDHFENDDNPTNKSFYELSKFDLVDIYYFPMKDEFSRIPEYLETTKIISTNPIQLSQFILKPTEFQQTDLSSFLFENLNLLLIISIGYLLIILFLFLFTKLTDFRRIKIKFNNLSLNYDQQCPLLFKFGLLKLFFNLFLFINLVLLTNTIKTDKVIVNTDEFLNTDEKLLKSPKKFVFEDTNEDRYRLSPKKSPIFQLYQKKVHIEQNYLIITVKYKKVTNLNALHFQIRKLSSFFMIDIKTKILYLSVLLSRYSKNEEFLYLDNRIFFELYNLFYFRKSLKEEIKKMIHWSTNQYFENGLYLEGTSKLYNEVYKFIEKNGIKIILNVNDYIDEQTAQMTANNVELPTTKADWHYVYKMSLLIRNSLKNVSDLINLRLVNKEFQLIIKELRILNVTFAEKTNPSIDRYWLKNCSKLKNYHFNPLNFEILSTYKSPFNFNDLKFLKNYNFNCNYFNISLINQFKRLLYLDLWIMKYEFEDNKNELLLLKLNTLIFRSNVNRFYITLNTPELKNLDISGLGNFHFRNIKFQHPLSIEQLKIEYYNNEINKFENLKCLTLIDGQGLSSNSLIDLMKLENFKIEKEYDYRKKKFIQNFYTNNLALNNRSINFYYKGILITNLDNLNQIDKYIHTYDDDLSFYIDNYDLIDYNIDFKTKIDYTKLSSQIFKIPSDFFVKFSNIQFLSLINSVINVEHLQNFIKNCKTLNSIKINNSSSGQLLNQKFYNNLPNICLYLSEFEITELNLNYQFILNQKYLKKLTINDQLQIDENFNLEKLNYLEELKFLIDNEYYIVKKYMKNLKSFYFLEDYYNRKIRRDYLNFDQLKLLCNNLKLHNGLYYF